MNSNSLLLRTGSGSIPVHVPTRPSVSLSVTRANIRRSSSELGITTLTKRSFSELDLRAGGGGGASNNRNSGGGGNRSGGGGGDHCRKIGDYYQEMIKSDSTNSLLLRNYAKYLYEVEGDAVKAEEYYGRAILASPGDGEVLSQYGKLIWETEKDESRARCYFTRALQASPHDCEVLASYANFLWEAEEKQYRDADEEEMKKREQMPIAAIV